jgi:ketosteroid isomerase-like protein
MRTVRICSTAAAALLTVATNVGAQARASRPADEQARLRAAIEASGARMADAYNNRDIPGFIRAYADDIWVFPPNEAPFQGRSAALDYFQRSYDDGFRNFRVTTTGVDRQGNMAYETGTYTGDFTPAGQNTPIRDNGKYVQIWKRAANGEWRTHFVMWSSNNPPPPTR